MSLVAVLPERPPELHLVNEEMQLPKGPEKTFCRESIIGVSGATAIAMCAVLCQLSIAVETPRGHRGWHTGRILLERLHAHVLELLFGGRLDGPVHGRGNDSVEGADDAAMEK
jgi:hypothetical protein